MRNKTKVGPLPLLCNLVGTLILLSVILTCLGILAPQWMGYSVYRVVSGSMEPEIPVGSAVYVATIAPEAVEQGDIIAFQSGDSVITHRVVKNQVVEGTYTTKGDANAGEDMNTVPYGSLLEIVRYRVPVLGDFMAILTSTVGKIYLICFAACGAMLNMLAGRIREKRRSAAKAE